MAFGFAARLIVVAAALLATVAVARGQMLQRLTVESFVLSSDTERPNVSVPFHLVVTLRVREHLGDIENLDLPMLAQLELLGDERQTVRDPKGTRYRESITVVARDAGTIVIAPATLAARDARDAKAKQWFTNGLTLDVGGAPQQAMRSGVAALLGAALAASRFLLWLLGLSCLGLLAVLALRRRRPIVTAAPQIEPPPAILVRSRREQIDDAFVVLRAERTRSAAARVRSAVWRMLGASEGETLGDVLRRPGSSETTMHDLLIALERSTFTSDEDLHAAIQDACSALERYAGSLA